MELRFSSARATRDMDITYFLKGSPWKDSLNDDLTEHLNHLARLDLNDFFAYEVGGIQRDLDAPYGGARYPIASKVDDRLFVSFHIDIGGDAVFSQPETLTTPDWLHFCGIPAPSVRMICIEQQFAEKIHAYTMSRGDRVNSRAKDLVDLILLLQLRPLDRQKMVSALEYVFKVRDTPVPVELPDPPAGWAGKYTLLATECGLDPEIDKAFRTIKAAYADILHPDN